jgi:hypothetical protein
MPTQHAAIPGASLVESMRGTIPKVASSGTDTMAIYNPASNVGGSAIAHTPETPGTGTGIGAPGSAPQPTSNMNGNAGGSVTPTMATGDNENSSATETSLTPDEELLDLAEAAMGNVQPGSSDTIALPMGDSEGEVSDTGSAAPVAAPASPLRPIILIGIIIGVGIGGWWVFKHRKNLAKAAKDAAP